MKIRIIVVVMIGLTLPGLLTFSGPQDLAGGPSNAAGDHPVHDTSLVATICGTPVILREFMLIARQLKPVVISRFRDLPGGTFSKDFWVKEINGKFPADVLKKMTLDTLVRIRVQQIRARQAGIIGDFSYSAFLKSLESENKRRKEAKEKGQVIYGPVQYSEQVYYNYLLTNMIARLMDYLPGADLALTEEKLQSYYSGNREVSCRRGFESIVELLFWKSVNKGESDPHVGRMAIDSLCARSWDTVSGFGELSIRFRRDYSLMLGRSVMVFNDTVGYPEEEENLRSEVREAVRSMEAGKCRAFPTNGEPHGVVRLKSKISLGIKSYEECRSTLRTRMLNDLYHEYVEGKSAKAECRINQKVYQSIQF